MGFFNGIYGFDILSMILLLLSSIFNIWPYTRILGLVLLLVVVFRTFSRNISKRRAEFEGFRMGANKFLGKLNMSIPDNLPTLNSYNLSLLFNKIKYDINQKKKYKTVICPGCRKKLKLPRGRGKVVITCKACSTEFKAKV
jgi:LSD1 subclass zinc finger protein